MTVDERARKQLHDALERAIGQKEAATLMAQLPWVSGPELATKNDLRSLELALKDDLRRELELKEARFDRKLAELETRLINRMDAQTKTLFRTFVVTNAAMVLSVATLAFGAARFA